MSGNIVSAQCSISCIDFKETLDFFTSIVGFRVKSIFPADNPSTASLEGFGLHLRLVLNYQQDTTTINLICKDVNQFRGYIIDNGTTQLIAPNGTIFELIKEDDTIILPELKESLIISHLGGDQENDWTIGRAGMRYRDLIPGRLGGRYIASHIHIPTGGPVPDYVHYHKVKFQMIFCYKGWVRVVYEDQGEPFILQAGDCVTQPPQIRHRVLEASDDLQVIEIGSPAIHQTIADFDMSLPNDVLSTTRIWDNQKFQRFQYSMIPWSPFNGEVEISPAPLRQSIYCQSICWKLKDTGIWSASSGLASSIILRADEAGRCSDTTPFEQHSAEFFLIFSLSEHLQISLISAGTYNQVVDLNEGSSICIPSTMPFRIESWNAGCEILEVSVW